MANAVTLLVSTSGVFGPSVGTTQYTAANTAWHFSYEIDSTPAETFGSLGHNFSPVFSNLTYDLGGVPVNTQNWTLDYESTSAGAGLLEAGFIGVFLNFFPADGLQLYSGPETSPTILTGSFPYSSAAGSDISVFFGPTPPISGTLTVTTVTPEPSTISLFVAMGAGLILGQLRTKRTALTREIRRRRALGLRVL